MRVAGRTLAILAIVLLFCVMFSVGCGDDSGTTQTSPEMTVPGEVVDGDGEVEDSGVSDVETTPDEEAAIEEALSHAEDANPGSSFEVVEWQVIEGWAKVALEETGVPREEAVGFGVYLRRLDDGTWEIVTTGTGVSPDDFPDAPPELFD